MRSTRSPRRLSTTRSCTSPTERSHATKGVTDRSRSPRRAARSSTASSRRRSPGATPRRARTSPTRCSVRSPTRSPSASSPRAAAPRRRSCSGHATPDWRPIRALPLRGCRLGGRPWGDGNGMVVTINGNCRNTPVEVFETVYPASNRVLSADSRLRGGWESRGGFGGERVFTVTVPEVTVSALLNRMRTEPWGIRGGHAGGVGGLWVRRSGNSEWRTLSRSSGLVALQVLGRHVASGDQVRIAMPGGGGTETRGNVTVPSSATCARGSSQPTRPRTITVGRGSMGEWRESKVGYLERYDVVCALCGQLVPGRFCRRRSTGTSCGFAAPTTPRNIGPTATPLRGWKETR